MIKYMKYVLIVAMLFPVITHAEDYKLTIAPGFDYAVKKKQI